MLKSIMQPTLKPAMTGLFGNIFSESGGSVPVAPVLATPTVTDTTIILTWTMSNDIGVTDYIVEYKASSNDTWLVFSDGTSTAKTATITGLLASTLYNARVKAVNANGESAYSNVQTISTNAPFLNDSNTYWWDFRSTQTKNVIDTLGDDTLAYAYEAIAGSVYKSFEQVNKSKQPLIKTNGIDFNQSTQRKLELINTAGICNATNGWYVAFNMNPLTVTSTLMRVSGASTSTTPARCWVELAGGTSTPQIRAKIGNNDSGTVYTLGLTPTGSIPNVATGLWTTVEVEVNISSGVAVMRAWINGTLQTLSSIATPSHTTTFLATNPNIVTIGNTLGVNDANSFNGEIQQMIFYNSVPSSGVRSSISSYLLGVKP